MEDLKTGQEAEAAAETPTPETAVEKEQESLDNESSTADFDLAEYMKEYKALEEEGQKTKTQLEEAEAKLLRLQADFDNYRRRQRSESEEAGKKAAAEMATSILPVLDNFDRALEAMGDTPDRQGVEMIAKQLLNILQTAGLSEIDAPLGTEFDPNLHYAVMQSEAGEENKNKITMVLQKGYTFNDKLIRATMVQVGM